MKTNDVELRFAFDDGATEKFTIEDVDNDALATVKSKIKTLNAAYPTDMKNLLVSADGASSTAIAAASIIETTETVIFEGEVLPQ